MEKTSTFLLATVVLAKVRGFKLVIGRFSCFFWPGWIEADPRQINSIGAAFSFFGGFLIV